MWARRAYEAIVLAAALVVAANAVEAQQTVSPGSEAESATQDQLLQLEVFVNGRPRELISAFTLHADGKLVSSRSELDEIGLRIPPALAGEVEIALDRLPGLTFVYDEAAQAIRFTAEPRALEPIRVDARIDVAEPDPVRPPPGAIVNYTLFASADQGAAGLNFDGMSAAIETRVFGKLGLLEHSVIAQTSGRDMQSVRLDTSYLYEDPDALRSLQAGDLISGGFAWTRPIRLGGLQVRRNFGLRPDLVTLPMPTLAGSALAPSTLELYVNSVRTLSAAVPQGPFEIAHPPVIEGAGLARLVLRDALGRETISSTPFYASPQLLADGLTDFSAEIGFARRNYATVSNDYDGRLAASMSWRRGLTDRLTMQAHGETVGSLWLLGGGATVTVGHVGLLSLALAGSRTSGGYGHLIDAVFESRTRVLSILLRTQRTFGDYEDLASWTAVELPNLGLDRRLFGQPRELDQASLSVPLPWSGSSLGASYVLARRAADTTRLVGVSCTQDLGPLSLYASAGRDLDVSGSTGVYLGVSVPLGRGVSGSVGASHVRSRTNTYIEASRQGHHDPGALGWTVRAADGERREAEALVRYGSRWARFEMDLLRTENAYAGHGMIEGALTLIGGGMHASQRVDESFALVEVGAPGVPVLRENRPIGRTDARGQLLIPHLAPFVANRIAIDPIELPIDAEIDAVNAVVAPFSRVAVLVDLRVEHSGRSALLGLIDADGQPIELGSEVVIEGHEESFVVGYDGQAFVQGLSERNVAIVTTPDRAVCRARFNYRAATGEQVRIERTVCEPER